MSGSDIQRYVTAVRAPNAGIPAMADGAWYVISDKRAEREEVKREALAIVPAMQKVGGDVLVLAVTPTPKPFIHRGALTDLPAPSELRVLSTDTVQQFHLWREALLAPPPPARAAAAEPSGNRTLAVYAAVAATVAAVLVGGAAWQMSKPVTRSDVHDLAPGHMEALLAGSTQMTMEDPNDARYMITVRSHPGGTRADGTRFEGTTEVVQRFRTDQWKEAGGYVPPPRMDWLKPGLQAEVDRVRGERMRRDGLAQWDSRVSKSQ